ncbi:MAG: hypothetical protein WBA01_14800, partial [Phormidesmis sp.]
SQAPTEHGADAISFVFSPNPGEPLQPLVEIASGGEMSRFLLALKACFSKVDPISTMVFDEIDVGVSGRVAQAIAEKLYQLGRQHQVLCVTHQPLVAAMADAHYHVDKQVVTLPLAATSGSAEEERARAKIAAQSAIAEKSTGAKTSLKTKSAPKAADSKAADSKALNQAANQAVNHRTLEERTIVKVTPLSTLEERRDELAQLARGKSDSEAIAFADSLLAQAETIRKAG